MHQVSSGFPRQSPKIHLNQLSNLGSRTKLSAISNRAVRAGTMGREFDCYSCRGGRCGYFRKQGMHHPRREHFSYSTPVRTFVFVVGTRPEVIKVAPVIRRLREAEWATVKVVTSGQQSDLLDSTLADFNLRPDLSIPHRSNCRTPAVLSRQLIPPL